jgi:hypothetical protein
MQFHDTFFTAQVKTQVAAEKAACMKTGHIPGYEKCARMKTGHMQGYEKCACIKQVTCRDMKSAPA